MNLSHSQLEDWESCQLAWAMNHVYHMPTAPNENFILGRAFHKALEDDTNAKRTATALPLGQLVNIAYAQLEKELAEHDPDHMLNADNLTRRLYAMLAAYVAKIQPRYLPIAAPERTLKLRVGDDFFVGVIDAQSSKAIMDWKTASGLHKWSGGVQHTKSQATAYLMLLREGRLVNKDRTLGERPSEPAPDQVTFIVFAVDPKSPDECEVVALATTREAVQIRQYKERIRRVAAQIRYARSSGVFLAQPYPMCRWCSYLGSCAIGLKLYGGDARVPLIYPTPEQVTKLRDLPDPDPDAPEACETCHLRGTVTGHIEVCARPAKSSFSLYTFVCEQCGVRWQVQSDADGIHRANEDDPLVSTIIEGTLS